MSEVLTNGIKVPDKGSRSWYDDMRGDLVKLDALIGSASSVTVNPVLTSGIEIASITVNGTSYSLYQQDGDIAVNIKPVTTNAELPILLSKSSEENTDTVDMSVGVTVNPSTHTVTASSFVGDLVGNATSATSATKATQDGDSNVITDTYATKSENALKANDANVVHLTGDETIGGNKTFSNDISSANATFTNTVKSAKVRATVDLGLVLADKDSTAPTTTFGANQIQFLDKNNVQLGYFQLSSNTNDNVYNWTGRKNANLADLRNIFWNVDTDIFGCTTNTVSLGSSSFRWSQLHCTEITTYTPNFLRNIYDNYGTFWRQDSTSLYLMVTASGDQNGSWTSARPIQVSLSTGKCYINGVCPSDNVLAVCLIELNVGNLVVGTNLRVAKGVVGGTFTATTETLTGTYRALSIVAANGVGLFEKLA